MTDIDELFGAFDEAPATQTPKGRGRGAQAVAERG